MTSPISTIRIVRQGPAGPAGPQGATGPQGPQGPQGNTGPQGAQGAQGPQGATGAQGATGPQGNPGPQGATGAPGATGAAGPSGPAGANGASWSSGSGAPSSGSGTDGDFYFRTDTDDVYKKTAGAWGSPIANLKGSTGPAGASTGWITLKKANVEQTVVTGTTSKTTSFSVTVPGGTLGANGALKIAAIFKFVGTSGTKQVGVDLGGTTLWSSAAATSSTLAYVVPAVLIFNRNSTSSQVGSVTNTNAGLNAAAPATSSIDMTVDQALTFWVQLGNGSDSGAVEAASVEYNNDHP